MSKYRTAPVPSERMPGGIPYIIGNEAAERFSFYGMKTILAVFMTKYLHLMDAAAGTPMAEAAASEKVHWFNSAVYFTPLAGALLCDSMLGKYRTIVSLSLVYCMGHAALAAMGIQGTAYNWMLSGLFLISLGSGGIKPCVSAHVGDQFGKTNSHLIPSIFNYFYFSINVGAFLSTLLTPWLLQWFGPHWAFGVPGALMALATLTFWMGRNEFIHIPARGVGFVKETFSREGLFAMAKLSIIYVFVAVFWALFDQTGSTWIFQAQDMDRNWLGMEWLESQIQAINPIFILIFIPVFTFFVYPAINRVFSLTPLRKISIGLFVMAAGFAIVSIIQEWIDAGQRPSIGWQILAYVLLTASEVMVSIVCLEFSYTQAPKSMKSMIMAFFLCSVSLGNAFTAIVNNVIQVPAVTRIGDATVHPGFDETPETNDDLTWNEDKLTVPGDTVLQEAAQRIEDSVNGSKTLPKTDEGQAMISDLTDPWGKPLRYRLMSSRQFRITSDGPDGIAVTRWDVGYKVDMNVKDPEKEGLLDKLFGFMLPDTPWLERRMAELGTNKPTSETDEKKDAPFTRNPFAGGQTTKEGADYFWFFTWLMLGTALVFVVVAKLYNPRTYMQEEDAD